MSRKPNTVFFKGKEYPRWRVRSVVLIRQEYILHGMFENTEGILAALEKGIDKWSKLDWYRNEMVEVKETFYPETVVDMAKSLSDSLAKIEIAESIEEALLSVVRFIIADGDAKPADPSEGIVAILSVGKKR